MSTEQAFRDLPDDVMAQAVERSHGWAGLYVNERDKRAVIDSALPILAPAIAAQARRQAIEECYVHVYGLLDRHGAIYDNGVYDALHRINALLPPQAEEPA